MKVGPLLLAALLALPLAGAQVPTLPVSTCSLALSGEPAVPAPIAAGESTTVTVSVANAGQLDATVTVAANAGQPGWTITPPDDAPVPAGGSGTFEIAIAATDAATEDALVSIAASWTCATPQGLCPPTQQCTGTANTQVAVPLEAQGGFTLPGLDGLSPEILIAGIVLIGLASIIPFAMRRKKGGVVADCPEPLKMVRAGRGTSFPIEIRNASKDAATAQFEVGPVPEGWSAFMPLPEVQLAAREARSLWLMVRSPQEAKVGDAVEVELRLRDPKRGTNGALVKVRAEVQGGPEA